MMYIAKVAVCSEIRTKHSTQSEHYVEFLNVKPVVRTETARLQKVNMCLCTNAVSTIVLSELHSHQPILLRISTLQMFPVEPHSRESICSERLVGDVSN